MDKITALSYEAEDEAKRILIQVIHKIAQYVLEELEDPKAIRKAIALEKIIIRPEAWQDN